MTAGFAPAHTRLCDGLGSCRHVAVPQHDGRAFEPAATVPLDATVQVKVRDALGEYILPFGCRHVGEGVWINPELGTALGRGLTVVGWRRRDFR